MMSKNSFWASMLENNKRRIWVWIVSGLLWFFYYPVGMALMMSRKKNHNMIDRLTGEAARARLLEESGFWLSANIGVGMLITLFAIVCAIQGFSYLYSRKKVDMYHSVPVKKTRRFAVIYINGILIYLIPNALGLLAAIAVAGVNGAMNGMILQRAFYSFGINAVLYAGTYGIAVLAVMLTGNLIITLFAVAVLLVYEWVVRAIYYVFHAEFFEYFCSNSIETCAVSSPMWQYVQLSEWIRDSAEAGMWIKAPWLSTIALGIVLALVFGLAAFSCYRLRPSEAAGKTMAFPCTKGIIKFLITVPFTLGVVYIVGGIVGDGGLKAPVIFTMVVVSVLANAIMEVIYELDLRAALRKKYQMLLTGTCAVLIYCSFWFDWFGFDAWVPQPQELEEAVIILEEEQYYNFFDENLQYQSRKEHYADKPGIQDVEAVCELSRRKSGKENAIWITAQYRMKNGKSVWRQFPVSGEETQLLDRIVGSNEYKAASYQLLDDSFCENLKQFNMREITCSNGFKVENLPVEDFDLLREAYVKDMEEVNYSTYRNEFACAAVEIEISIDRNYSRWFEYNVYPSFKNTRTFLEERGIDTKQYLKLEEIESITVTNYHHELREKLYNDSLAAGEDAAQSALYAGELDVEVHKTFSDEEQIRELAQAIFPMGLSDYWKAPDAISEDYYVTIQYKDGKKATANYRGSDEAHLITAYIPKWLEAETAYK